MVSPPPVQISSFFGDPGQIGVKWGCGVDHHDEEHPQTDWLAVGFPIQS